MPYHGYIFFLWVFLMAVAYYAYKKALLQPRTSWFLIKNLAVCFILAINVLLVFETKWDTLLIPLSAVLILNIYTPNPHKYPRLARWWIAIRPILSAIITGVGIFYFLMLAMVLLMVGVKSL